MAHGLKAFTVVAVAWVLLTPTPAVAHHPGAEQHPSHATIASRALFDFGASRYRHDGVRADVLSWSAAGDYAFRPWASVGLRLGVHRADPASGSAESGLGDTEINARARLSRDGSATSVIGGFSLELPTGSEEKGLGSGHLEAAPFVAFSRSVGSVMTHGGAAGIFSFEDGGHGHGGAAKPNFVNPHEDKEFRGHLGAVYSFHEGIYLNGVLAAALPVSGSHKGDVFLDVRPEFGWTRGDWAAAVVVQLPLTDERRFDHQTLLQVRKRFGR